MAEGLYWVFVPIGIALTTPGVFWTMALLLQQELAAPIEGVVDRYQQLVLMPFAALSGAMEALLPAGWDRWAAIWASPFAVFSFGGAAYISAWYAAGLQRALGLVAGSIVALALMLFLGATLLGLAYLVITYLLITRPFAIAAFIQEDGNDVAIGLPLIVPLALAGLLLAVNALM